MDQDLGLGRFQKPWLDASRGACCRSEGDFQVFGQREAGAEAAAEAPVLQLSFASCKLPACLLKPPTTPFLELLGALQASPVSISCLEQRGAVYLTTFPACSGRRKPPANNRATPPSPRAVALCVVCSAPRQCSRPRRNIVDKGIRHTLWRDSEAEVEPIQPTAQSSGVGENGITPPPRCQALKGLAGSGLSKVC